MISICFNWANLCILAKIHSYRQDLITISPKAINSILTIKAVPRPTVYRIVEQTLSSSRLFFKDLNFLIHSTARSSTLSPFPTLRKYWGLNYCKEIWKLIIILSILTDWGCCCWCCNDTLGSKPGGSPKADRPRSSPQATDDHRLLEREDHGGDNTGRASS